MHAYKNSDVYIGWGTAACKRGLRGWEGAIVSSIYMCVAEGRWE